MIKFQLRENDNLEGGYTCKKLTTSDVSNSKGTYSTCDCKKHDALNSFRSMQDNINYAYCVTLPSLKFWQKLKHIHI